MAEQTKEPEKYTHRFELKKCPVVEVKIYNDRAEVKREVKVVLKEGEQFLRLTDFPETTIHDSARVIGESEGDVTVLEVVYHTDNITVKNDQTKRNELQEELKKLNHELREVQAANSRLNTQNNLVDSYANSIVELQDPQKSDKNLLERMTDKNTLDGVSKFLTFYHGQLEKINNEKTELVKQETDLQKKISDVQKQINKQKPEQETKQTRELSVLVQQAGQDTPQSIFYVTYHVTNASWRASYDVRVTSDSNTVAITYHGIITQKSGEAWRNTKISLSTANPSLSSEPPKLNGITLGYKPVYFSRKQKDMSERKRARSSSVRNDKLEEQTMVLEDMCMESEQMSDKKVSLKRSFAPPPPVMEEVVAEATQGATSSTYAIPRNSTIPSDGHDHKVTIGVAKLEDSVFTHYAVPRIDQNAYLKVKAKNSSPFSFLKGTMNVFFDGNFVSTGELLAISPGEEFETFLSRDPGIKIEYKPPSKFRETKGIFSKSNKTQVKRRVYIKNNKQVPANVVIKDQLPLSNTEQIKVTLVEPQLHDKKEIANVPMLQEAKTGEQATQFVAKTIKLDDAHLLEWTLDTIAPQGSATIPYTYILEWPLQYDLNDL